MLEDAAAVPCCHGKPSIISEPSGALKNVLFRISGLSRARDLYASLPRAQKTPFLDAALEAMGIRWEVKGKGMDAIPVSGGALVVANHPFGGIEGLVLLRFLLQRRSDVKILANHLLLRIPELAPFLIGLDVLENSGPGQLNSRGLRAALRWLKGGGLLACFPAGEVSSFRFADRAVADPDWSPHVIRLALLASSPVLPVYFRGSNGLPFQLAGLLHPRMRTLLLPRELVNKKDTTVTAFVGTPVDAAALETGGDPERMAALVKLQTYALGHGEPARTRPVSSTSQQAIAPVSDPEQMAAEIDRLPFSRRVAAGSGLEVWVARAVQIPSILDEIGVQREIAFRAAGEGSGKARDLDRHDRDYYHIFLWNPVKKEIAGAYRMGPVAEILASKGFRGLYSSTLFHLSPGFLSRMRQGLEMGRSFLREGYRGTHGPLFLLWKGIGRFVAANPDFRFLFGPVSMSDLYHPFSRDLLVSHFAKASPREAREGWVKPRHAFVPRMKHLPASLRSLSQSLDLKTLDRLISQNEPDGAGVPVLFKYYTRLGGQFFCFSVDPLFGNTVDGLVVVDLMATEPGVLAKYLGSEGARAFREHHETGRNRTPARRPRAGWGWPFPAFSSEASRPW